MKTFNDSFQRRIMSLRIRIEDLSSLRKTIALPAEHDISERQWFVIESELKAVEIRLSRRLKRVTKEYLPQLENKDAAGILNGLLGEIELEMSKTYTVFDTFMDVLTQRNTPELGGLLAGCDALALDAIRKNHPALQLVEPPLVYCDRGFGASTLREGIRLPGRGYNPTPLIQIPYSRLKEKCNLTSIFHEIGHEALVRLKLNTAIPKAMSAAMEKAKAPAAIRDLFALWCSEIGPDFWTFCSCGIAEAATIREILSLPPPHVFRLVWSDPHPPPYLRALITFDWCRQVWGNGVWDDWEKEWLEFYPLKEATPVIRNLLTKARQFIPVVGRVLLKTKFRTLNGKTLPELFDLSAVAPKELKRILKNSEKGKLNLKGLSPSVQLAMFRLLKEEGKPEEKLDKIMTDWLLKLGEKRNNFPKINKEK
jgi:hypothetical protein